MLHPVVDTLPPEAPAELLAGGRRRPLQARRLGLPLGIVAAVVGVIASLLVPVRPVVPRGAQASTRYLRVGGRRRSELVVQPADRNDALLPLYVVLHGSLATPAYEERRTELAPLAARGRAVLVYPRGVGQSWNAGQGCCGQAGADDVDDVAFVRAVVDNAVATLGVSPSEVFLVGYSNGGKLALRLAAADPGQFAGVAVYAAVPLVDLEDGPPIPVLVSGGTADDRTPYSGPPSVQGGATAPSVTGTAAILRRRDGADGPAEEQTLAGGKVRVTTWRGSNPRAVVQLVSYEGRDHSWPQTHNSPLPLAGLIERFFDSLGRHR